MTVPFGMGSRADRRAHGRDVINCLASDAAGYENARSFEDWANDYGYDTDSRKRPHTYEPGRAPDERLKAFLGDGVRRLPVQAEGL